MVFSSERPKADSGFKDERAMIYNDKEGKKEGGENTTSDDSEQCIQW